MLSPCRYVNIDRPSWFVVFVVTCASTGCGETKAMRDGRLRLSRLQNAVEGLTGEKEDLASANARLRRDLATLADENETAKLVVLLRAQVEALENTHARLSDEHKLNSRQLEETKTERDELRGQVKKLSEQITSVQRELENAQVMLRALENPLINAAVFEWKLIQKIQGASLYAQDLDRKFLGIVDFTGTHVDSIFNESGLHGSPHALDSIWNEYSLIGSPYGIHSPNNPFVISPPLLYKNGQAIAALTANEHYAAHVAFAPQYLKALFKRTQAGYVSWIKGLGE